MSINKINDSYLIYLVSLILFLSLFSIGSFSYIEKSLADNLYSKKSSLSNIVIIEIDDYSIQNIGRWPWDRKVYAEILDKINSSRAIGIDISFFENSSDDLDLRNKLADLDNVVLAEEYNDGILYKPIFGSSGGYVNLKQDSDGIIRTALIENISSSSSFAHSIYKKSWNGREYSPGTYNIKFYNFENNYISFYDVLNGNYSFDGKITLIGASAPNLHDKYSVPVMKESQMNGVEIHANILQNMILDDFVNKQSKLISAILIIMLSFVGMFILSKKKVIYSIISSLLIILFYIFVSILLFSKYSYLSEMLYVPLSLVIFGSIGFGTNYLKEKKSNLFITNAFGKYVNKHLVDNIIRNKQELKLGGEKKNATIFFSDIRGFTSISEKLSPEKVIDLINSYLEEMTKIIHRYNGNIDKFIGDAIMAVWNAPKDQDKHEELACRAAIEQVKQLRELNKSWKGKGFPELNIGCGINTGEVIVGNVGSDERLDYTAIGDNVNLSSRIEGLTKEYGVSIIVSENTFEKVKDIFKFRKLDKVSVKGKTKPVTIYELCVDYNEEFVKVFEKALEAYFSRDFRKAINLFKEANKIKPDKSCNLFVERCLGLLKNRPSPNWDGSYVMKTK